MTCRVSQTITAQTVDGIARKEKQFATQHCPAGFKLTKIDREHAEYVPEKNYGPTAYQGHYNIYPAYYSQVTVFNYEKEKPPMQMITLSDALDALEAVLTDAPSAEHSAGPNNRTYLTVINGQTTTTIMGAILDRLGVDYETMWNSNGESIEVLPNFEYHAGKMFEMIQENGLNLRLEPKTSLAAIVNWVLDQPNVFVPSSVKQKALKINKEVIFEYPMPPVKKPVAFPPDFEYKVKATVFSGPSLEALRLAVQEKIRELKPIGYTLESIDSGIVTDHGSLSNKPLAVDVTLTYKKV